MSGGPRLDPITLSVLSSALSGIAEEMGTVLVRSAYSSNIKERRDCSAALFDAGGRMVAQAEHIPVHLGAMPEAVAAVMARDPGPGDVYVVNDPFSGGNHLPDITMVSYLGSDREAFGFAVTRAHHSDVGGMQPGSMPAGSRDIWSEGLVIPPVRLVRAGEYVPDVLDLILANINLRVIRAVLPALATHLAPNGAAILSGVLHEHEGTLREVVREAGLSRRERRRERDWLALVVGHARS